MFIDSVQTVWLLHTYRDFLRFSAECKMHIPRLVVPISITVLVLTAHDDMGSSAYSTPLVPTFSNFLVTFFLLKNSLE